MGQAATRKSLVAPFHQRVVLFSQGRKSAGPRYVENAKYSPRIRHLSSRNQLDQQKCVARVLTKSMTFLVYRKL